MLNEELMTRFYQEGYSKEEVQDLLDMMVDAEEEGFLLPESLQNIVSEHERMADAV